MRRAVVLAVALCALCRAHSEPFKLTEEEERALQRLKENPIEISIRRRGPEGPDLDPKLMEKRDEVWNKDKNLITLNDDNFEHDTQAASGSTTGDWFVSFSAPWCDRCKELMPALEAAAMELMGETNVAIINAFREQESATRFKIDHYPTLLFFHDGKYCDYKGVRGWVEIAAFCRYKYVEECEDKWQKVPPVRAPGPLHVRPEEEAGYFERLYLAAKSEPKLAFFAVLVGVVVAAIPLLVFYFDSERVEFNPETGEIRAGSKVILPARSQRKSVGNEDEDKVAVNAVAVATAKASTPKEKEKAVTAPSPPAKDDGKLDKPNAAGEVIESSSPAADQRQEKERVVVGSSDLLKQRGGKKNKKAQQKGGE